jgi:uncharacterized ion transporter superfamily protein YfcC
MQEPSSVEQVADPTVRDDVLSPTHETADPVPPNSGPGDAAGTEPKKSRFPTPLGLLIMISIGVWLLALAIPSGEFAVDDSGRPVPGSFQEIDSPFTFGESVTDLVLAPVNGFYGIQDPETGQVGPFNSGFLFGSAQVIVFILMIGGFMTVVFKTGALDAGIGKLAHRFRTRGPALIIILSLLFGLLGSFISWSDETLGFYALMIPLFLALGYDRIVVVSVVTVAPFVGSIGATINPFRIGIGSDAAGVSIGDGLGLRIVLFALTIAATIVYTLRYARRVQASPEVALVPHDPADEELVEAARGEPPDLTRVQSIVIGLVVFTFVLLVFSIVPWGSILHNTIVDPVTHETVTEAFSWELGWWLPELSAMFLVMAIIVGFVGGLGEKDTANAFIRGVVDFTGPAILVAFARGVSVILTNTKTIDTVLDAMEGLVGGRSSIAFILILAVVSIPLAFLVGSGSAGMALVMPILAPLGDFAGVDRSLVVTTYNSIGAILLLVLPTNVLLVAGLALARVPIGTYYKFILPLVGMLTAITIAVLLLGVAFS